MNQCCSDRLNPSQLISGGITKAPLHSALRERLPRLTKGIKAKGDGAVGWHGMERREGKGREEKGSTPLTSRLDIEHI